MGNAAADWLAKRFGELNDLKDQVKSGKLSLINYQEKADEIIKKSWTLAQQSAQSGSSNASATNPVWQQFVDQGFASYQNGRATVGMPFSKQEYAKLPNEALPTQEEINNGLFDPTIAPLQRIRNGGQQPAVNPGPGGESGVTSSPITPTNRIGTSPVYNANPNSPPPYGGLESNNQQANIDAQKIAQEAALQEQLAVQASQGRSDQRKKYLTDLSGILKTQQNQQFTEDNPMIMEDLNSRGLLKSSELGNAMARELKSLQGTTTTNLAKYGLEGETTDLTDLKEIQDSYSQARNSALQRQFSVEDYNKQIQAGKEMGESYSKLTPNQGKAGSPATTAAIMGGSQMGAATIAKLGTKGG